jgi:tetratricopeptide (TPR) repeat protein
MKIMNHTLKMLAFGALLVCNNALAQPNRETDAAVQYKNNFLPALMSNDKVKAKKAIEEAKKAIDDAAAHPETQNSPKTFLLRGDIYFGYMTAYAQDTVLMKEKGEEWLNTSLESYKKSLELAKAAGPKVEKKIKPDVKESIYQKKGMMMLPIGILFERQKFTEALSGYEMQIKLSEMVGDFDTTSFFNSGLCHDRLKNFEKSAPIFAKCARYGYNTPKSYVLAASSFKSINMPDSAANYITEGLRQFPKDQELIIASISVLLEKGKIDECEKKVNEILATDQKIFIYILLSQTLREAKQFSLSENVIGKGRKIYPTDRDLLLEIVNLSIAKGDNEGAEKSLNEAIAGDPNNKQLHYVIGTIYSDLKQNEKADTALRKALELDPNYKEALYQLGAHLITWAGDVRNSASKLKIGDPNYDKLMADADGIYTRAIEPLEKYVSLSPKDVDVLNILSQLYRNLSNYEKANEYKKKAEEASKQ